MPASSDVLLALLSASIRRTEPWTAEQIADHIRAEGNPADAAAVQKVLLSMASSGSNVTCHGQNPTRWRLATDAERVSTITGSAGVTRLQVRSCRAMLLALLDSLDGGNKIDPSELVTAVPPCASHTAGLSIAELMNSTFFSQADDGFLGLSRSGDDWLLTHGRPPTPWRDTHPAASKPLRDWQVEALDAWSRHGRHGVVEAVTGTGKSRVGIEAAREAIAHDFSVLICVPTVDLVEQWANELKRNGIASVGTISGSTKATWRTVKVLVSTVQSLYQAPPVRDDGKVLLIADECHRYGSRSWSAVLQQTYQRRLGLTATFERNDDGIERLHHYFGGPVYKIGFDRAISTGVVARYGVKLLGVNLTPSERRDYDYVDKIVKDAQAELIAAGVTPEPFGEFMYEVSVLAESDDNWELRDLARRFLKAFADRITILSNAEGKIGAARKLAPLIAQSRGTILFTRRVEAAELLADVLVEEGIAAEAIHSDLSRSERRDRLGRLGRGRTQALVAPAVLDEGIDIPDVDLGIVMGGSKSRRQMIQRMGRVLRLKADGRPATFVVVFAANTTEDLTQSDGAEGCLDLIINSAESVSGLSV